ncbi:MAG: arpA protein [Pseudomonadota bacterium]
MKCRDIINHPLFPIDELDNPLRRNAVQCVRDELAEDGCAVIRHFFSEAGLDALVAEADERKPYAYYSPNKSCNVYLNEGNANLPDDHPVNVLLPRTNGFVRSDEFGEETASHQLYYWEPLKRFLADCLEKDNLHIYEDPISNMIVNVGQPGEEFNWHFDTNEFTITMLLRPAREGGHFEYVPGLRTEDDERYHDVKQVLEGDRSRVRQLALHAGDLQFFLGRFALHRVTKNTGDADRLVLIMSFADAPGMVGSKARVMNLYGKTTDAHEQRRVFADGLSD